MRHTVALFLFVAACAPQVADRRPASEAPRPAAVPVAPVGNPAVGGAIIPTTQTIAASVATAPTLGTLARAVAAATMAPALSGTGPVTLFAPADEAWGRLAPGTVDALLKPENRASLTKLLNLHVVAGALTGAELMRRIQAGGGRATVTTLAGEPLVLGMTGNIVTLTDSGGNKSYVEVSDVRQANGIIHVVNGVLVPRL